MHAGVANRASILCFCWVGLSGIYGFISLDVFHQVMPNLTLTENVVPRLLFNALPALFFAFWYRNYRHNSVLKSYSTAVVLPGLLVSAAMIHAWPIFFNGNHEFYLYFHATNIVVISSVISMSAGPPKIIVSQIVGFLFIFFGPLLYLFLISGRDSVIAKLIFGDYALLIAILFPGLYTVYKLRLKLALADQSVKDRAAPFLGETLAHAIYEGRDDILDGYTRNGLVMSVDIRGYTGFMQQESKDSAKEFMHAYHRTMIQTLSQFGGYLHKSNGDGHIISFGVMDKESDMSDIPGLEGELEIASQRRRQDLLRSAIQFFESMLPNFEALKVQYKVQSEIKIGASVASGDIEIIVRGDASVRQEFDIDGEPIVRAARLEAYTKLLSNIVDSNSSYLVISPEFAKFLESFSQIKMVLIDRPEIQVRDYPDMKQVFYRQWKHKRERDSQQAA